MTIEVRRRIPPSIFLYVENLGTTFQEVRWYHSVSAALRRKDNHGGRVFELPTSNVKEIL